MRGSPVQFNSTSLNRHMTRTYNFGNGIFGGGQGFVEVLAATQTPGTGGSEWFQGTADAVRQYSWLFADVKNKDVEDVLILSGAPHHVGQLPGRARQICTEHAACPACRWRLCECAFHAEASAAAGDHLYRMDYMAFVKKHRDTKADVTVAALPMDFSRASDFGLMKVSPPNPNLRHGPSVWCWRGRRLSGAWAVGWLTAYCLAGPEACPAGTDRLHRQDCRLC